MQIIIDSEEVDIDTKGAKSFEQCCSLIMAWLVEKDRSISTCKIDGKVVDTMDQANQLLKSCSSLEVETVSVSEALQAAISIQAAQLTRTEEACEQLVTDSLLEEPEVLVEQWHDLCEDLKAQIRFIPSLAPLLTEDQINMLVDKKFKEIEDIMREVHKVLNEADVVTFSDILELKLSPWISTLREFVQAQAKLLDSMIKSQKGE